MIIKHKNLTIDNSVHAVMVAFAFGSVTNVYSYFLRRWA